MSFDAMWLHVLRHVAWCNAMSCDARSCNESSSVVPCNGTWCYELKMPLVVTSPCVVRSGSVTMWWSKELYYKVLQRTRVLLHTTKYYSSTTLYYKVFLQYYSVLLESTTPVLPCTTKYYSSTTLHYIVLLQYYSVLQRTIPVLPCTTKYYNILRHYYPALQSSMPVLRCTTKYYSVTTLHYKVLCQHYYSSTTLHYKVLQHTTPLLPCPTKYYASTTLYYNVLLQYYSVLLLYYSLLQSTTPALLCTTKYYSVLQNTIPVLFCTTTYYSVLQSGTHDWSFTHMKGHLQCAEQQESSSNFTKYRPCHAKWISWLTRITYEQSFTMSEATGLILQRHQILRLPRKMNLMIDPAHMYNIIYIAPSNRTHTPASPNTAPAAQNESHDWSASHMKRHLQGAEQKESIILQLHQILHQPRKIASENLRGVCWKRMKRHIHCGADSSMIGPWSKPACTRPFAELTFRASETHFVLKMTTFRALAIYPNIAKCCACHEKWQSNITKCCAYHEKWHSNITNCCACHKRGTPTSPNTAPAAQNDSHDWSCSHAKHHLQCAEQQDLYSNVTKYWACCAKWLSWLILLTCETSNVRSNRTHTPTSPNTAPAAQNDSHDWSCSHMKRHLQCVEQQDSYSTMRGATALTLQHLEILQENDVGPQICRD